MQNIIIIGAGKGGEVIADTLRGYRIIGYLDDNVKRADIIYHDIRAYALIDKLRDTVFISIASNMKLRQHLFELYKNEGIQFINAIHPTAVIEPSVILGEGNFIGANVYIGTGTVIGNNNWIASGVTIDHHNRIGNHNLFGTGFCSPGIVEIGDCNRFGANASLSNYTKIGNNNVILNNAWASGKVGDNQVIGNKYKLGKGE
jgi:UDP-3-O-[3-hydroxymyristoyl] glucosamine N-acyltransferase